MNTRSGFFVKRTDRQPLTVGPHYNAQICAEMLEYNQPVPDRTGQRQLKPSPTPRRRHQTYSTIFEMERGNNSNPANQPPKSPMNKANLKTF